MYPTVLAGMIAPTASPTGAAAIAAWNSRFEAAGELQAACRKDAKKTNKEARKAGRPEPRDEESGIPRILPSDEWAMGQVVLGLDSATLVQRLDTPKGPVEFTAVRRGPAAITR